MRSRDAKTFCCENQTQTHMVVGRVYGIKTPEGVLVYIGSSTMASRIASHRSLSNYRYTYAHLSP